MVNAALVARHSPTNLLVFLPFYLQAPVACTAQEALQFPRERERERTARDERRTNESRTNERTKDQRTNDEREWPCDRRSQ